MIAAFLAGQDLSAQDLPRFAAALPAGRGRRVRAQQAGQVLYAAACPSDQHWSGPAHGAGWLVLLAGQLHNHRAVALELGLPGREPASLYAAALNHWGDAVDEHCIGHYATIAINPISRSARLSRSPFQAPPLHFRLFEGQICASQLARHLFWNTPDRPAPDLDRIAQMLVNEHGERFRSWYLGAHRVPLGSAVSLDPDGWREVWRYDLFTRPKVRLPTLEAYVARGLELFDEGVAAALEGAKQPAVLLSGGLDSASVAASVLLARPQSPLHAFTFGPESNWHADAPPGQFLSDFPAVRQFAAANPRIILHCDKNTDRDLRYRVRDLVALSDAAPSGLGLAWIEHGLFEQAAASGCDVMLCGTAGNIGFSTKAPWAFSEFLLRAKWRRLAAALRSEPGDTRNVWHKLVARAVMPLLPNVLWQAARRLRGLVPGARQGLDAAAPDWPGLAATLRRARRAGTSLDRSQNPSRQAYWRAVLSEDGQEQGQYALGMELLHGLPLRDPTAYRPLMEFCWGCPTEVFMQRSTSRWLAREMGRGRLPEAQRTNRDYGLQYVDWQPRLLRARDDLIEELSRIEDDPDIAAVVDLPRLRALLENIPVAGAGYDRNEALPYQTVLPLGLTAARFIAFAKGRNDF